MSDIVFLRTWVQVALPRFFTPVTSLLDGPNRPWRGMRTVGEIRREAGVPIPVNKDSLYKVSGRLLRNYCDFQPFWRTA